MAQFFKSFKTGTVGQIPSGFTDLTGATGKFEILDLGGAVGKVLAYRYLSSSYEAFLWWTDAAGPGSILNGDMLSKIRYNSSHNRVDCAWNMCRIPNPPTDGFSNQMIGTATPSTSILRIQRVRGYTSYASSGITFSADTDYYIRMNFNGTTIKSRFWQVGTTEPATWNLETTANADQDPGYIGMQPYNAREVYWHWISVSDDPAILASNVDDIATPVNPGFTNLLATSVRLTWEQG